MRAKPLGAIGAYKQELRRIKRARAKADPLAETKRLYEDRPSRRLRADVVTTAGEPQRFILLQGSDGAWRWWTAPRGGEPKARIVAGPFDTREEAEAWNA